MSWVGGIVCVALIFQPSEGLAAEYLRSPDRSVQGDFVCESGSVDQERLQCINGVKASSNLGKRSVRSDHWRGVGNVWCKPGAIVRLHRNGYLAECVTLNSANSLQRRDGSLSLCEAGEKVSFDDEGFFVGRCRRD